ncbi:MAG: DUF4394 domain-containing protein [Candidatus Limnocylindrales bacterium]
MGTRLKLALMAALAVSALGAAPVPARDGDPRRDAGELYSLGLTGNHRLICFEVTSPEDFFTIGRITGLAGDTDIVGIDYRVANGLLYALGDQGGIYTVDDDDASATKVDQLDIALVGDFFGVDFNPAADALRVISDQGQDLRHPFAGPTAGTTVMDGTLNYVGPPAVSPALRCHWSRIHQQRPGSEHRYDAL